jgi:hypothetical protein
MIHLVMVGDQERRRRWKRKKQVGHRYTQMDTDSASPIKTKEKDVLCLGKSLRQDVK